MSSKKMFFVMSGVIGLMSALLIATVVYGDNFLRKQSAILVELKLSDQVIEAQKTALGQAKRDIEKYKELKATAKQIVPQDKEQTEATREILNLAQQSGIKIASISFPPSTLGQAAAPKSSTPAPSGTAETRPPAAAPTVSQVKPVEGIKNLFQLDIVVTSDTTDTVSYTELIDFLGRLEQNRRTAQVTQISIQPDSKNRQSLNFTLTVTIYVKP